MIKIIKVLFVFVPMHSIFASNIYEVPIKSIDYTIERVDGFERILISGSYSCTEPGYPELPAITYSYLLPQGQKLVQVDIVQVDWEEIPGNYYLYPKQRERAMIEEYEFTEPNLFVYGSGGPYPEHIVVNNHSGNMRGYQIGQVGIAPFRYFPLSGRLQVLKHLVIKLETEQREIGLFPKRQTSLARDIVDRVISSLVVNSETLNEAHMRPASCIEENREDAAPTNLPSLLGAPVDLLVITTESQLDAYEDYARYKKSYGYNEVVKTLSWVREHYQGVDDAERLRNFIRDAHENWGVLYVLLGGDVPDVPSRWLLMAPMEWEKQPFPTVTDHYFSDLDSTWNKDGDHMFCELEDSLGLYPDVFVGRLPTTDTSHVREYKDKIDIYLHPVETHIQARALFPTSYLDRGSPPDTMDAYNMAKEIAQHLPSWFDTVFLHEKTRDEFRDSVNAGFGIVSAIGHGGVHSFQLSRKGGQYADYFFIDSLVNTNRYALLWVISCLNQPFQSNCVTKPWIQNPSGGGIGSIALTHYSDAFVHKNFTIRQFDSLFIMPLGASLAWAKIYYNSISQQGDNWYRKYQFTLNLMGDPALELWDSIPLQFSSVTITPDTIYVGIDSVTIEVDPPVPFDVVFFKEGESFIRDSSDTGTLESEVKTESSGYLKYNVMSDGYISYIDSIVVDSGGAYCVYNSHTIVDTMHNDDGVINPGEDVWLHVVIENTGGSDATVVDAQLVSSDALLTMVIDTASYVDIVSGGTAENLTAFHFQVSEVMPDDYSFNFELVLDYSGGTSSDSFQLIGSAPELVHFTQKCVRVGDTVNIAPYLVNYGHTSAGGVYGRISAYSDTIVVVDSMVDFPIIDTNTTAGSAPDSLRLYLTDTDATVRYNFRVYNEDSNELINHEVVVDTPVTVDSVWAWGKKQSVVLQWSTVSGAVGYRVYRASDYGGDYTFLNNDLEPTSHFEDLDVQLEENYYYYVTAVDSSMNEGTSSDTVCGRTNPLLASGWPQAILDYCFASPNFGDIDTAYPGLEIVTCGRNGNVYAWHYDGTPVQGDGRLFYFDPPITRWDHELWSSPAIGDMDADGSLDIVFGLRRDTTNLYAIDNQGNILTGWPKTVLGGMITSPVLADIDEDGDLEIFVWTYDSATVYAFHHDGTGVYSPNGILEDLHGYCFGTVAIGDINCDGDLEIVCCGGSQSESLYVWKKDGSRLTPPFPVAIRPSPTKYGLRYSAVLGNVLGDDNLEICFYVDGDSIPADTMHKVCLVGSDGTIHWSAELPHGVYAFAAAVEASPVIADITGDGHPEICCAYYTGVVTYDSLGNIFLGFPDTMHNARTCIIADVDHGNDVEMIVGSANWRLYGYKNTGHLAPGFPMQFGNYLDATPAAYDIDEDGKLELMVSSNDYRFCVFDLETEWTEWPKLHYDLYHSGTYKGFPPASPHITQVEKAGGDAVLTWNKIVTDVLGNPEMMDHYVVYRNTSPSFVPGTSDSIATVSHPDTQFTDSGVLTAGQSYYYLVKAIDWAQNTSEKSNMGYVFNKFVNENAGATDKNWGSFPYTNEYASVADLTSDLSSGGDPLTKITNLRDDQLYENWSFTTVPFPRWTGTNFQIVPAQAYEMVAKKDTTLVLVGCNEPDSLVSLNENDDVTDKNWVSIPYNADYSFVKDITDEYAPNGSPLAKITNLRDDQLYENWSYTTVPFPRWTGTNFTIEPGRGYEFVADTDTTWNPTEYANEIGSALLTSSAVPETDLEMHTGTLTGSDRAPVWALKVADRIPRIKASDNAGALPTVGVSGVRSEKHHYLHRTAVYEPASEHNDREVLSTRDDSREVGISHLVRGYCELEEFENLVFTAYRSDNPFDALTENVVGCGYAVNQDYGLFWFDVGNFKKPWKDNEEVMLIIEALQNGKGYFTVVSFVLDRHVDIQELGRVSLEPVPTPQPRLGSSSTQWNKVGNENVIGYSVYCAQMRVNERIITEGTYAAQGDVSIKPVVRGGYETVYGSQGSQHTPDTQNPRDYAFTLFPNPFTKYTQIDYALPKQAAVKMEIYDVSGRRVKMLVSGKQKPGYYSTVWNGTDNRDRKVASGIYFIRFTADPVEKVAAFRAHNKVLLVK